MTELHIEVVLQEFLAAQDAGQAPEAAEYVARFPALSAELTEYFESVKQIESAARFLSPAVPPFPSPIFPVLRSVTYSVRSAFKDKPQRHRGRRERRGYRLGPPVAPP